MYLTLEERETILLFNEKDDKARVNTFNARLIKSVRSQAEKKGIKIDFTDKGDGEVEFYIPKRWIMIRLPNTITEEQREKARQLMKNLRGESHE